MMKLTCEHGARPTDLDSVVEVIWAATDLVFSQAAYQNVGIGALARRPQGVVHGVQSAALRAAQQATHLVPSAQVIGALGSVAEASAAEYRYLWDRGPNHVIPFRRRLLRLEGATGGVR